MILAMALWKDLRQIHYFMLFVQLLADAVGSGIGGVLIYMSETSADEFWVVDYDYQDYETYEIMRL